MRHGGEQVSSTAVNRVPLPHPPWCAFRAVNRVPLPHPPWCAFRAVMIGNVAFRATPHVPAFQPHFLL